MEKQGNITLPKVHSTSMTEPKDTEMAAMPDKEFKSLFT
jgi:hypothetical protein